MLATAAVILGSVVAGVVAAPAAMADTQPQDGVPKTVTADPLPTTQINGVAWAQEIVGNTVYVGGEFTAARPAGAPRGVNETPRANLLAYNLSTGVMTSWNPGANGSVRAIELSPDGQRLYIAGNFTQVAGQNRYRLAAFNAQTGALLPWNPGTNARIDDIAVTDDAVYMVGAFSSIGSDARVRVGGVSVATGATLPLTAVVDGGSGARAIEVSPDGGKVVIGGSFTSVNGSTNPGRGLAALSTETSALLPWSINSVVRNGGSGAAIYGLASDGDSVYGVGYDFGGGDVTNNRFEGVFRSTWDGQMVWIETCHGDNYSVAAGHGVVYTVGHDHDCSEMDSYAQTMPSWDFHHSMATAKEYLDDKKVNNNIWSGYRNFAGNPGGTNLHWYPEWQVGTYTGSEQAGWDVEANDQYAVFGGEFLRVNNNAQEGLVRFALSEVAPDNNGPRFGEGDWAPTAIPIGPRQNQVSWLANYDRDNEYLTYQLLRQDRGNTPLHTVTASSSFWNRPTLTFTDTNVTAGQTYQYRVRATDASGNTAVSAWASVTASATGVGTAYDKRVLQDGAHHFWPLNEGSGTAAKDWAGRGDLTYRSTTLGEAGPDLVTPDQSARFAGNSNSYANSDGEQYANNVTVEAWFNSTSTQGGKIVGFGNRQTGNSTAADRSIHMSNNGTLTFTIRQGSSTRTIASSSGHNNGQWHHVVGVLSYKDSAMYFYVDGVLVGYRSDTYYGLAQTGYWRVGGDALGSSPANAGSSVYLNGRIADVAVYEKALTIDDVRAHYSLAGYGATTAAPADAYGAAVYGLDPSMYLRVDETSGSAAADSGKWGNGGQYFGSVTRNVGSALSSGTGRAVTFNPSGSTQTGIAGNRIVANPKTYTLETWFRTTSTAGGKIIGLGGSRTGASSSSTVDRHVYMSTNGRVKFGVYDGAQRIIQSDTGYNNGQWHHVVATQSAEGMRLYIDGVLVDSNDVTGARNVSGYWRVGGDTGWEGATYWSGSVDEVAVYTTALTAGQVASHYAMGSGTAPNFPPTAEFSSVVTDLTADFDASASTDDSGAIEAYEWKFGDNTTGTGVTTSHTYAAPGTYTVELTVTDTGGAKSSVTHEVTVTAPNVPPTAAFTFTAGVLTVSVDGSGSSDSDGTIASYVWDFGDGAAGAGVTATHDYEDGGDYDVTLTVTDNRGGTHSVTRKVSVEEPPNEAPTAAFTVEPQGLTVSVDAGGSEDSDGTIASYAWKFGDGATGTGKTASHTYDEAGTYEIELTVTDNDGATDKTTRSVTVATTNIVARDLFGRNVSNGLGTADTGGAWQIVAGPASRFSVSGGAARFSTQASQSLAADLTSTPLTNARIEVEFSVDKVAPGQYIAVVGRTVGSSRYLLRLKVEDGGTLRAYVLRDSTQLGANFVVPNVTLEADTTYRVVFEVAGTSPTNLAAKVWKASETEPASWQAQRTDSNAALQAAGPVGLLSQLFAGQSAFAPVVTTFDNFKVTDPTIVVP